MQLIVEYRCLVDWQVTFCPLNFAKKSAEKKTQGITPSQENRSIYPFDTEGGDHCWRRLPSASHKKYRRAAALKRLKPVDDFRHHVGVVRPLQVEDAVSYGRNWDNWGSHMAHPLWSFRRQISPLPPFQIWLSGRPMLLGVTNTSLS